MSHVEYVKSKRTSKQWNRAALQLYRNLMNILNIIKLYILNYPPSRRNPSKAQTKEPR